MKSLRLALLTAAFAAACSPAFATQKAVDSITQSLNDQCVPNATQITARADLEPVFGAHPVDAKKVCDCAVAAFLADPKLKAALMADDTKVSKAMQAEPMKAYMNAKLTGSVFKCISPEIDNSLSAVPLDVK